MANKRIELEQHKFYNDLLEEEPTRKTVRTGLIICMVVAILLVIFMFVMGLLSNDLAKNPRNVLEKPPEKPPAQQGGQIPGMPNMPGGQQLPSGTQQLPQGVPPPPQSIIPEDLKAGPGFACDYARPVVWASGSLIAQETPPSGAQAPTPVITPSQPQSTPPGPTETDKGKKKQKKKGPGEETKGVGSLANLVKGVSGRGFQLYVLVLSIGLIIVIYLALRRVRREGKAK